MQPFLFVALDYPDFQHIYSMVEQLDDVREDFGYKLNLDFLVSNPSFLMQDLGTSRPTFADMKMWNGVRTMAEVCRNLQQRGFEFTNLHALCGVETMTELMKEVNIGVWKAPRIKVFGVTILTHYDDSYCRNQFKKSLEEKVIDLVDDIENSNLDGVILPGPILKRIVVNLPTLVPAVRPEAYEEKRKDQRQTISVREAAQSGADMLVCGSPITKSEDPRGALVDLLNEMKGV